MDYPGKELSRLCIHNVTISPYRGSRIQGCGNLVPVDDVSLTTDMVLLDEDMSMMLVEGYFDPLIVSGRASTCGHFD